MGRACKEERVEILEERKLSFTKLGKKQKKTVVILQENVIFPQARQDYEPPNQRNCNFFFVLFLFLIILIFTRRDVAVVACLNTLNSDFCKLDLSTSSATIVHYL